MDENSYYKKLIVMENIIETRSEVLFLYEIENANPNGDPFNENRPRFDNADSKALVSDVRLKRSIRDYWFAYKGYNNPEEKDIFVRETKYDGKGKDSDKKFIRDGKRRAAMFKKDTKTPKDEFVKNILNKCIDIRVFGGVIPLDKDSITFTGPVQFQMGKSLHKTSVETIQGTGAFASSDGKQQATFRTEYVLPYAVIGFNGIINEKAAEYSMMQKEDRSLLLEGIWEGTKNLISRSKFGQTPLFLLTINYKEPYHIGNLRQRIKVKTEESELKIRSTDDFQLDLTSLFSSLKEAKDKIEDVVLKVDNRLQLSYNGTAYELPSNQKINLNEL